MIHTLKKYFPSVRSLPSNTSNLPLDYTWFQTEQGEVVGIQQNELTEKDHALLSAFLTEYHVNLPPQTEREKLWTNRISEEEKDRLEEFNSAFRFIYFQIRQGHIEPDIFKATIQEFFTGPISILWHNEYAGILVEEEISQLEESLSYAQISDTLMSELYIKTAFYVGPFRNSLKDIVTYTNLLTEQAPSSFQSHDSSVVSFIKDYPFHLIKNLNNQKKNQLSSWILKEFSEDIEVLETIQTFIESNLNLTEASKKLYMHRNSIQYRLDKFHESTGIDVKQFEQAITVYLAILANMHKTE
ncbi:PucR family transcriptional regulator [Oceanobacillus sp. 1P07AA]|uniref:PucR family transcriptional regulator n=1 Tax=Oceanobacillus sp. 1P07AA TaxID=3132293 RepID=UPI0039A6C79B